MSLSDIHSPRAVLQAIEEYERVGAESFLRTYGFAPARAYHLVYRGRRYPSKAIIAVAHRYAFPEQGPLQSADFSGGEATVRRKLEALGFNVEVDDGPTVVPSLPNPRPLRLFEDYDREQVHDIFAPRSPFTPQSGSWGLHGIIPIPERPNDFVFFVTFGQQQAHHVFDEGISEDGVLSWQSQPRQALETPQIKQFINHDELTNNIYLFLRTGPRVPYAYLGRLKYLSHDNDRERPVYFQWQLLDWPVPTKALARMRLTLMPSTPRQLIEGTSRPNLLVPAAVPSLRRTGSGTSTRNFQRRRTPAYEVLDRENRELGLAGELLVLAFERERLTNLGLADLAERIRHVSAIEGDGAGYDIQSFDDSGAERYIEVKTTRGLAVTPWFMSANEVAFAERHPSDYSLYRVFEYDGGTNSGRFFELRGNLAQEVEMEATTFRVVPASHQSHSEPSSM